MKKWDNLVQKGIDLVASETKVRWAMADLLAEVAPVSKHPTGIHRTNGALKEVISAFIEAIGWDVSYATAREYRDQAIGWPKSKRVKGASWSAHRALCHHPNRFELLEPGMTFDEATELAERTVVPRPEYHPEFSYEDLRDKLKWANSILKTAKHRAQHTKLDFRTRAKIANILEVTEAHVTDINNTVRPRRRKAV